jgi:VanZ family protein
VVHEANHLRGRRVPTLHTEPMNRDRNWQSALASKPQSPLADQARDPHRVLKAWIAAVLWLIVIAIESTAWLSSEHTSRFLYPVFHFLFGLSYESFEPWNHILRKAGHVVGYGFLSFLLFRAWRETLPQLTRLGRNLKWTFRWSVIAVFGTAIIASLDEWHQSFIPSRTGRWQDVVLDTCAGIATQFLLFLFCRARS